MRFGKNALVSLAVSSGVFGTAAAAAASERSGTFLRNAPRQRRHLEVSFENCAGATENFSFSFDSGGRDRGCTYANFRDRLDQVKGSDCAADADSLAAHLLGVDYTAGVDADTAPAEAKVDELCREGYASTPHKFDFDEITKKGPAFDNEYYSGGTYYNYEIQNDDGEHELATDAARIRRVYRYQAQKKTMNLPLYHEALDPEQDGCELDAMFCCWVQDRQAGDNNGNCNTPYGSHCVDSDPGDNTNFCYTDHARSGDVAAHVHGGFSVFADAGRDNGAENIEGAVHCHGFAWAQDDDDQVEATHPSVQYKGNNLFYVSLYDHMYQRGYVRNAPGSAMCGCAENMAVVTRADCTEIEAHETWTFDYDVAEGFAGVLSDVRDINFNACNGIDADGNAKNNDLEAYYRRLVRDGHQNQTKFETLRDTLVGTAHGQCRDAVKGFMRTKGILTESEFQAQAQAEAVSAETQSDAMVAAEFEAVTVETQTLGFKAVGQTEPEDDPDFVAVIDPEIAYEESFPDDGTDTMPDVPTDKAEGKETPNPEDEVRLDVVDDVVDPQAFGGAVNELDLVPTAQTVNPPTGYSVAAVDDPVVVAPAPTVSPPNPPPVDAPLVVPPVDEPPVVPTVAPVDQPNVPPATLGGRNDPCTKNSDCASNKCKGNQKCQAPAGTRRLATAWWK